jgi:hypothetical protein
MPRIALYYTVLNDAGYVIASQVTQDPAFVVGPAQRLVQDQVPDYDSLTHKITRVEPVPAGQDHIEYQILPITYTDAEVLLNAQTRRQSELTDSDWTQLPDVNLTADEKSDWAAYRQLLRDVPAQAGYPRTITWPTKPV